MNTIQISGYPLETPMRFENVAPDTFINENHWLLPQAKAAQLIDAWRDADTDERDGDGARARASIYSPLGVFVTALHLDHELRVSEWESVTGSGDTHSDLYSTATMPFDFRIEVVPQ